MKATTASANAAQGQPPSNDRVFATIPTGRRGEELRIALSSYKRRTFLAVRVWYADDNGVMQPSSKGINFKVDMLPGIAEGIRLALEAARRDGLVPSTGNEEA
jgi:hypothetical protein